jgi:putative SOS response-associated peptidase YedK
MCYHTSLVTDAPTLEKRFNARLSDAATFRPTYHASAFGFPAWPILTRQEAGRFHPIQWGLIPRWVRSAGDADQIRAKTINARAETIFEKPAFRTAAQKGQRCLIPMTGFYEWHTAKAKKYPFYISTTDQPIFSVAGLWDEWPDAETGALISTYTLLTTDANPLLAAIHNTKKRMPCVLTPEAEQAWLHENLTEQQTLDLLTNQYPADHMHSYSISKLISSRTEPSDVPAVLTPVDYPELAKQTTLFAD